ncbi:MAG TPA: UDP-N-acetylglucosamine 2-epimerase, partial [Clostridiales bacterium]|nr:UDP-N-acetylglucosamine 2-epimerase [Clostridiales bacterium]
PEETNRKIVDHISDINMPYSDISREYLLREGLNPDRVIKTGSPMQEVISANEEKILSSDILKELKLKKFQYFVVSAHREENINSEKNFKNLFEALNRIAEIYKMPVLISTHPRTRIKLEKEKLKLNPLIITHKPFGFSDYVHLQLNAKAVLSDSGTISEESSIMNFPAVNIRDAHERPEAMEEGSVMMTGMNSERILQALKILETQGRGEEGPLLQVYDYSLPNVSDKVLRIIISYTDYIKRVVWSE